MTTSIGNAGPFDINTSDLTQIGPELAVDLFRQLLVIEACSVGIPITNVDVPAAINVADGGIDAEVSDTSGRMRPGGLISEGLTRYQIKTGSFSASTPSDIRSLLVRPSFATGDFQRTKEQLQPRVLSCFERGGTFVVVLFGSDLVGTADDHGVSQIKEFMTSVDPSFAEVAVRIIRANQLCSAIKTLAPGIALRLNRLEGQDDAVFQDLSLMADTGDLEIDSYQTTEELQRVTAQITQAADRVTGFQHVRVLGDAGSGKTHLIYRALSASALSGCVLYCRDPEQGLASAPMMALTLMSQSTTIILAADECDLETAEGLTAFFRRRATKMLLVTAHNVAEPPNQHSSAQMIEMPRLEQPAVAEIFQAYGIPANDAGWLANLCEGSPRAAHRLGKYIKANPEQHLTQHLTHLDMLWEQIVCAPHRVDSEKGGDRLAVIRTLALFRQVAWDTGDGPAVQKAVLAALRLLDASFSPLRLAQSINSLRNHRVLQGPRTLLISPKLLHVAMWRSWFENYSSLVDVMQLREGLEARMQQHFDAMLMFAVESRAATVWAERLMGEGGVFASLAGYNSASGASLFFAVAQAKPKAALRHFADALGRETVESRQRLEGDARRTAIQRLEQLAVPAETFFEAAQCLLLLAEAENESWTNNATGTFISLFSLGHGELAASALSPMEKLGYLHSLLRSETAFHREIAVKTLSQSLDPFLSRNVIEETVGLRRLPGRWMPATFAQIYEAYAAHVKLLHDALGYLPSEEARVAADGVLSHFRSLVQIIPLAENLLAFMRSATGMPELREQCITTLVATLHFEETRLDETMERELRTMLAELVDSSFSTKLRRYAGMKLISDNFGPDGEYNDAAGSDLVQLVDSAIADPELLTPELAWLVTDEAKNGFQFGQQLGQADDLRLWTPIVSAWIQAGEQRSDFFVGGYLSAVHAKSTELWERLVEELVEYAEVRSSVLNLVWRSGISDRVARKLLEVAEHGGIDPKAFKLFVYGGAINRFPLQILVSVVDLLLAADDPNAPDAAVEILESRLRTFPGETSDLATRLDRALNSAVFVEGDVHRQSNNMLLYFWNEAANRLFDFDSEAGARLAVRCVENFANAGSVTAGHRPESLEFLSKVAQSKPAVIWSAVARRLEERGKEVGTWHLLQWLRGGKFSRGGAVAGLDVFPPAALFEWIDVAPTTRAWILASQCPPHVSKPGERSTIARQILERYGSIENVRQSLHANNFTESWSGLASEHYRSKLESLNSHLAVEVDHNVRTWLVEHRDRLEQAVDREAERELRDREN